MKKQNHLLSSFAKRSILDNPVIYEMTPEEASAKGAMALDENNARISVCTTARRARACSPAPVRREIRTVAPVLKAAKAAWIRATRELTNPTPVRAALPRWPISIVVTIPTSMKTISEGIAVTTPPAKSTPQRPKCFEVI